jgi:hypothetical protein
MRELLPIVLLVACASSTAQQPGSRGPRADEHLAAAEAHDAQAERLSRWPDRQATQTEIDTGSWYRRWDTVSDQLRLARIHRSQAAQLQAEYEEACGARPYADVSVSPLQRYGTGGAPTERGVTVFLAPEAGTPDQLLAAMRCHRAWMMLGRTDMDSCPLDLAGIHVDVHGDAKTVTVDITIDDPKLIPELQRRAAHDLEAAAKLHE